MCVLGAVLVSSIVVFLYLKHRERKVKRLNSLFWRRAEILGRQRVVLDRAVRYHRRALHSPDIDKFTRGLRLFRKRMKRIEAATTSLFEQVRNGH